MSPITVTEIDSEGEKKTWLSRSALDIMIAGQSDDEREFGFYAAHSNSNSVVALSISNDVTVWIIEGDCKQGRKDRVESIRQLITGINGVRSIK